MKFRQSLMKEFVKNAIEDKQNLYNETKTRL